MKTGYVNLQGQLKGQGEFFNTNNLILNGIFKYWYSGTSSAPDAWTLGNGSIAREGTIVKIGDYSAKLTRSGSNAYLYQRPYTELSLAYMKGKTFTFSAWVYATVASRVRLYIYDDINVTYSDYHTGGSGWELLYCTQTIDNSAGKVEIALEIVTGDTSGYIDGTMFVEGSIPFAYQPHKKDHLYEQQTLGISYQQVIGNYDSDAYNSLVNIDTHYAYPKTVNGQMMFPINLPVQLAGNVVSIDSCIIYYNTQANGDYIDRVRIAYLPGDGTTPYLVDYQTDIANGSSGNSSQEIISTPQTTIYKPTFLWINVAGTDTNTDVRIYGITISYHIKAHG